MYCTYLKYNGKCKKRIWVLEHINRARNSASLRRDKEKRILQNTGGSDAQTGIFL